jgi:hypothetical protein
MSKQKSFMCDLIHAMADGDITRDEALEKVLAHGFTEDNLKDEEEIYYSYVDSEGYS